MLQEGKTENQRQPEINQVVHAFVQLLMWWLTICELIGQHNHKPPNGQIHAFVFGWQPPNSRSRWRILCLHLAHVCLCMQRDCHSIPLMKSQVFVSGKCGSNSVRGHVTQSLTWLWRYELSLNLELDVSMKWGNGDKDMHTSLTHCVYLLFHDHMAEWT